MAQSTTSESKFEVRYEVIKPFKYAGKRLEKGDSFVPGGGLFDDKILNGVGKLVRRVESAMPAERKR